MRKIAYLTHVFALMLVLFIDGMGQGIIFPILSKTLTNSHSALFLNGSSLSIRNFWFGIIVGSYYLMWFITAPLLGDWSDQIGRKKPLLLCLSLASASFLMAAIAFQIKSLSLLLISRLIGGATSGDQAIAKAAVIDVCPNNRKPIYLGLVLCAVTLGLVVGPLIGSVLQNIAINTKSSSQTPFYFAAIISLANILLLQFFFTEKKRNKTTKKIKFSKSIELIVAGFKATWIKYLLITYCLTQLAWQIFYIDMQNFVSSQFHLSNSHASIVLSLLGIGIFIGLALLPHLFKKYQAKSVCIFGYSVLGICIATTLVSESIIMLYATTVIAAAFFGLAAVNMLALFSERTDENQQGWVMGITGSVVALTGGIGALLTGILTNISLISPYLFALSLMLIGLFTLQKRCSHPHATPDI